MSSDLPVRQTRTSAATSGFQRPAGVASSAFNMVEPPKKPVFDPNAVLIRAGVPIPADRRGRADAYGDVLRKMNVGDSVELITAHARTMASRAKVLGCASSPRAATASGASSSSSPIRRA